MKTILVTLLLTTALNAEMTAKKLLELSTRKHQEVELIEPLKLFTSAGKFEMKPKFLFHKDPNMIPDSLPTSILDVKKVSDKTLFISFNLPPLKKPFLVAISFDETNGLYNKHMLTPQGQFRTLKGIALPETRTVHWHVVNPNEPSINLESYTDNSFTGREAFLGEDGEVMMILELNAQKLP